MTEDYTAPTVDDDAALWVKGANNEKTGDVPTMWIGRTREESLKSCEGCPLLEGGCYAQFGRPAMAHSGMTRAHKRGKDYSLETALANSRRAAKMARLGGIGDPGALRNVKAVIRKIRDFGLDAVGYTHHWRGRPDLAGELMASCETLEGADQAIDSGYRAAVVLESDFLAKNKGRKFTTPKGRNGIVCPAIVSNNKVTCNDCRLCDGSKPGPVIGFPDHGPKSRRKTK